MKSKILFFLLIFAAVNLQAQKNLSKVFAGENGMSKTHLQLTKDQQFVFDQQKLDALFTNDAGSRLTLKQSYQDNLGFTHYRFKQTYRGYEIQHASLLIHVKNGLAESIGGEMVVDFGIQNRYDNRINISEEKAIQKALQTIQAKLYAWQDPEMEQALKHQTNNTQATYKPKASLVWYNPGDEIIPNDLKLAYRINIYARAPLSRADYYIDAKTGELLGKTDRLCFSDATGTAQTAWSGPQTIHSDFVSATNNYRLRDVSKGALIVTLHGESGKKGQEYFSTTPNWSLTGTDIAALDAHYGAAQTWQFYKDNFNRNSYDNNGTTMYSYVNDPTYIDNAFWDGQFMYYCKRSGANGGVTGIDVCGHELTHGVTQETSGLVYSSQSGGINESLSDIMGKSVQFWSKPFDKSWLLSNDMNWIIRNMANPNQFSMPDTYLGTYWSKYAGVHTLSGVGNFMFVLLVDGGSGTNDKGWNYNVSSIGLDKADQIIYRSNAVYLTANSKYPDWRVACINAATDIYGAGSNEVLQVKNAFYAVGLDSVSALTCAKPNGLGTDYVTNKSAVLNWNAVTNAKSYIVQWKKTSDLSWITVSGVLTNSYKLSGLVANTSYDFKVQAVCDTNLSSIYSSNSSFVTAGIGGYCTSKGLNSNYEFIQSVRIRNRVNNSGNDGGYGDYSRITVPLKAGTAYTIYMKPGFASTTYTEYFTVYIDYNKDRDFLDPGEKLGTVSTSAATEVSLPFTVPVTAKKGVTLVRIQMVYGSAGPGPCGDFSYGEVEDYTSDISGDSGMQQDDVPVPAAMNSAINSNSISLLLQPNPVSGSTALAVYELKQSGFVQIDITNTTGNIVKTIAVGNLHAGSHNYNITGLDQLKAGTYFLLVRQDGALKASTQLIKN